MNPRDVAVLGAGLAGLGFARHWPGCIVYEAENEPGGQARSHEFCGAWFAGSRVRSWLRGCGIETVGLLGAWEYVWSDRAYAAGRDLAESMGRAN